MEPPPGHKDLSRRYNLDPPAQAHAGTPYPCTQFEIDDYQHFDGREVIQFMTLERATQQLVDFLKPERPIPPHIYAAIMRLRNARWDSKGGPDMILKVLHDMDTAFFNSRLRGKVVVRWSNTEDITVQREDVDATHIWGLTSYCGGGRCSVFLNADTISASPNPCRQAWQTLFHELLHAYKFTTSGVTFALSYYDAFRGWDATHGFSFRWLISHLEIRAMQYLYMGIVFDWENFRLNVQYEESMLLIEAMRGRSLPPRLH